MDRMLNFFDSEELKASLVELKYADSKFSFVIVLPHPSSNLQQLASKIRQINLANVFNQMRPHGISLRLPKFKVEYSIQLKEILKQVRKPHFEFGTQIWSSKLGGGNKIRHIQFGMGFIGYFTVGHGHNVFEYGRFKWSFG